MESLAGTVGVFGATLVAGVVSGLVPVINGEIYLIGVVLVTHDLFSALVLAVLMAIGQMVAKAILYQTALHATNASRRGKLADKIDRAREATRRWQSRPLSLTFISSVTGLPPFYVVTLVAGVIQIRFRTFLGLGLAGRLVRFATIASIAVAL